METSRKQDTQTATIAKAATTSDAVRVMGKDTGMFLWPAAFTGATVTFQGAQRANPGSTGDTEGTYGTVVDSSGNDISATKKLGKWAPIPASVMAMGYIKFVSASSEAAARSIIVCLK